MVHKPSREEMQKKWAQVVAKAWKEEKFKAKLLSHPTQVLQEQGIHPPANKTFRIIEENSGEICLVLPTFPTGALSETELKSIAAARTSCYATEHCTCS